MSPKGIKRNIESIEGVVKRHEVVLISCSPKSGLVKPSLLN
jgi:hypothetical protein